MTTIAFVDVSVVPMDRERVIEHQTVLVEGDSIAAFGPAAEVEAPRGVTRIDGRERYLMPGLCDMHVHYNEPAFGPLFVANGVTTVRNMWGFPQHLELRTAVRSGAAIVSPDIYTCGPLMDGNPPLWLASEVVETAEAATRSIAAQAEAGYDFIKVYNMLSGEVYDAIIAAAREHDMRVVGHVPARVGLQRVLDSGQASLEHLYGYLPALVADGSPPMQATNVTERFIHWTEYADEAKIPAVVAATVDAGAWNCVTMIVNQKFGPARLAFDDECKRPELRFLSPAYIDNWRETASMPIADRPRAETAYRRAMELRQQLVSALRDAGARLLLGGDTPNPFVIPGFSAHDELALLVQAGLTPYEAVRAGTSDAAQFLQAEDDFGTVTVGKRADLILCEGSPLDDVRNAARRAGVMLRGRWLPAEGLDSMLEDVARHAATA
jgi:cytosine/adenosine deaminase-related metal-dependent hydrolase